MAKIKLTYLSELSRTFIQLRPLISTCFWLFFFLELGVYCLHTWCVYTYWDSQRPFLKYLINAMTSNLNIFVIIIPIAFYIICIINLVIIATNYHELFSLNRIVFYRDSVYGLQRNYSNEAFLKSISILFCCSLSIGCTILRERYLLISKILFCR